MTNIDIDAARQVASRVAARSDIRDVRLLKTEAELNRQPELAGGLSYELNTGIESVFEEGGDSFVVQVEYTLNITELSQGLVPDATAKDDETESTEEPPAEQKIASIKFTHAGLFSIQMREGDEPASSAEIEAYGQSTGLFALYPYAREFVYNLTGRLGLPPLTLGVLRLAADRPNS